jgi:hypothetical protein
MKKVKFINAQLGTHIYHFKGTKEGLYKTYASIWMEPLHCNIIVIFIQLCTFIGSNCDNWIIMNGKENVKKVSHNFFFEGYSPLYKHSAHPRYHINMETRNNNLILIFSSNIIPVSALKFRDRIHLEQIKMVRYVNMQWEAKMWKARNDKYIL